MSVASILANKRVPSKVQKIPGRKLNQPVNPSFYKGDVGVEIELEGRDLPTAGYLEGVRTKSGTVWAVKDDGSLRNGREYVLNQPTTSEEVEELIRGLFEVFEARGTRLTPSNRCSIHVHYNIGSLKVNSITSIIALWTVFEEPLLKWWGIERYKNHFCLSTKDEEASLASWENFLRTGRLPSERNLRYTALNLVAIATYGSLEFRGGGAVREPNKAITWVKFLDTLCKYAVEKYPNPRQIAYDLSERGPSAMLKDICGEQFEEFYDSVLATVPDFNQTCTESFHNFQPILFDFPWDEWTEEVAKPYVPNPFESKTNKLSEAARRFANIAPPRPLRQIDIRAGEQWIVDAAAFNPAREQEF